MDLTLPAIEALDFDLSQFDISIKSDVETVSDSQDEETEELREIIKALDEDSLLQEHPLHRIVKLVKAGKEEDVRRELEELSEDERTAMINERDILGYTALQYAAKYNHVKIIELLLKVYSIDPEIKTEFHHECTALHLAAMRGSLEAVKLLLDPKKHACTHENVHDQLTPANVDSVNEDGRTPLHLASTKGHAEVVTVLLEYGAEVDMADANGRSPLHMATENSHVNVANVLLHHGACVDKEDSTGAIPLHLASENGTPEMIVCLLEHGAVINKGDNDDQTALHFACRLWNIHMNVEGVTTLLEHGADVTKTNSSGETPLHIASQALDCDSEVVKLLLEHGADANIADKNGMTPLAQASEDGSVKTVTVLLKHGADKEKRNLSGTTPLHLACRWGHAEVVKVLLDYGASVTKKNSFNQNPLMLAIQEGHEDVVMAFLEDDSWKRAMKICSDGSTPMREMIKRMPDVAAVALDRCTETSDALAKGNYQFRVTFDYEMVEDFRDSDDGDDSNDVDSCSCLSKHGRFFFPKDGGFTTQWGPVGFSRDKHPLSLMARSENLKLLKHPLVTTLLRRKWRVTQFVYFINLLFYCIFLGFLTAFALTAPNPQSDRCEARITGCDQQQFVFAAGVITIILGIIRLVMEVLQMIQLRVDYFTDWVNWMEIIMVIFSIIFVWVFNTDCLCPQHWQWQIGTIAVFLAWVDFIIFVQKLPGVGIYVVMLIDILWIFIKTVPLTIMLVIAFGLGLFMALFEPGVLRSPFSTPARSLLSIVTYATGGFDFDAIFRQAPGGTEADNVLTEIPFPTVSYIMWIIFIIIMPILLNNLLIGLAVGDINDTLKKAEGKKIVLEIELTLSVEATLPAKLRRKFIIRREKLFPNQHLSLKENVEKLLWGAHRFPTGSDIATAIKKEDNDPVKSLPQQTLSLAKDVQEMKNTMSSLSQDVREMKHVMKELQKVLADTAENQTHQAASS